MNVAGPRVKRHGTATRRDYRVTFDHAPAARPVPVLRTFAGGRLFGATSGSGPAWVLALPGWMRTHRDFDEVLEGVDGIAVDLPGFGATPMPPDAWSTREYAEWIAPVLDDLAPGAVVVGHSFGGRVAAHLAALRSERVGALILAGVPLVSDRERTPRRSPPLYRAGRALHRAGLIGDARMESLRGRYGSSDYRAARGVMRGVLVKAVNETYEAPLAAYTGPVELVWGEDDQEVPVRVAIRAQSLRPSTSLTVCAGGGHLLPTEAPACLGGVIRHHRPQRPEIPDVVDR